MHQNSIPLPGFAAAPLAEALGAICKKTARGKKRTAAQDSRVVPDLSTDWPQLCLT